MSEYLLLDQPFTGGCNEMWNLELCIIICYGFFYLLLGANN